VLEANTIEKEIDAEWLELILEAKEMGITLEEIHEFLTHTKYEK
jgi:DNA-binding transcriptional MerR regulator